MQFDVPRLLRAVTRAVEPRVHEGRPARVIIASRDYDTTPEDLWNALTDAERIPRWFLPVTGELRLGGHYKLQGNASGKIVGCEPPKELALTWEMQGDVSWVTVRLAPAPTGGTRLELEHIAHVPDEWWNQYGPGAVGVGWDLALIGLDAHVRAGSASSLDPAAVMAWTASSEGGAFVEGSSEDWGRASIAAGTPAVEATGAAARTTAFYKGEGGGEPAAH